MALATLCVSHPLQVWNPALCFESFQSSEKYSDGMPSADCVLRPSQIFREEMMGEMPSIGRHCEQLHRFVVQRIDRGVYGVLGQIVKCRRRAGEADRRLGARRRLRIIESVLESGSPVEHHEGHPNL